MHGSTMETFGQANVVSTDRVVKDKSKATSKYNKRMSERALNRKKIRYSDREESAISRSYPSARIGSGLKPDHEKRAISVDKLYEDMLAPQRKAMALFQSRRRDYRTVVQPRTGERIEP